MDIPTIIQQHPTGFIDGCGISGFGLYELLKDKGSIKGLEIGCDKGVTTTFLLEALPKITLYGVDPYTNYIDWNNHVLYERADTHKFLISQTVKYGDRFKLIRKTSDEAVADFPDNYFDFIFIDGLHTYDQVKKDCENFYPKVKEGGLFSGHDFMLIEGVHRAVTEFAESKLAAINTTKHDVWYWIKK